MDRQSMENTTFLSKSESELVLMQKTRFAATTLTEFILPEWNENPNANKNWINETQISKKTQNLQPKNRESTQILDQTKKKGSALWGEWTWKIQFF